MHAFQVTSGDSTEEKVECTDTSVSEAALAHMYHVLQYVFTRCLSRRRGRHAFSNEAGIYLFSCARDRSDLLEARQTRRPHVSCHLLVRALRPTGATDGCMHVFSAVETNLI
jgi:hypothetical protein